ncbi:MAG: hypothetical protein NVS1B12_07670 [Acidimicrobiales bacterium]
MRRAWVLVVIVVGAALGVAIAGVPTRHQDPPLRVSATASTSSSTTAPATTTTVAPHANRTDVGVVVLNAGGLPTKGADLTAKVKAAGYTTFPPQTDNTDRPSRSVIEYQPGYEGDADAVSSVVGIGPVQALSDSPVSAKLMGDANVLVVVGTDLH